MKTLPLDKNSEMKTLRYIILLFLLAIGSADAVAQVFVHRPPIYIVNGVRMSEEEVKRIDPDDIATNTLLPADEESVAKYGQDASNGVIIISLRYDTPARFEIDGRSALLADYVNRNVKWEYPANPVARVVIRLNIQPDGQAVVDEVLEATDKRLLKRVQKALATAPRWVPAMKDGKGVESTYTLRMTLPLGMKMPRERSIPIIIGGS